MYPGATEEECVPVLEEKYGPNITIYDPWANPVEVMHEYGLESTNELPQQKFDAVVLAVAHQEFLQIDLHPLKKEKAVVYDVKAILKNPDGRL